ncbi:DegT/DnrJ/EryC1/StrS aminotransferase family protein [Enterococcus faecalis RP2S-4]|uniref:DegT/DnrJ/EryC1/StrS aminotransferase family protein n=2 Tax=Enterococcus faecalis TaxID=1351 RepID=A0ABC9TQ31_ENTFL|nr:DegT/DnrJ/EryC1/StrS aminotransferase family protein [Enterococcus faecalis RP2S-4]
MSDEGFEKKYIHEAFDTNWIAPLGNNVNEFEHEVSKYIGINDGVALSSGTAAIHLALKAAGVEKDDIVICQSLTFSATANPIIYEGAIPVFVDSELETWNMDPEYLKETLKKYPQAKAVLIVHLYGMPANIEKITAICDEYNVPLIEDAAESLGSTYKGKHTGTFGKYGILSFNGNKIITTSGGGMLLSDDIERLKKVRFWATQSKDIARHYQHSELGYNYRMSNILAGIGRGQLKILNQRIGEKRKIYNFYKKSLDDVPGIRFVPEKKGVRSNFWLTVISLDTIQPAHLMDALEAEGIESRPVWKPMHLQPFFRKYDYIGGENAQSLFETGMCLPSDTKMTEEDLEQVSTIVRQVLINE